MMQWLFTTVVVPLMPYTQLPEPNYQHQIEQIQSRLNQSEQAQVERPEMLVEQSQPAQSNPAPLPKVTGAFLMRDHMAQEDPEWVEELPFRLTGVIELGGQRAAIVHDGQIDHVVAVNSYLGSYRVVSVTRERLVLSHVDTKKRGRQLALVLQESIQ